ncbi:MAG: type I restriction enzyme M protein [Desulforhopalus sp.]|jgi:type I restriction enzyme M protein
MFFVGIRNLSISPNWERKGCRLYCHTVIFVAVPRKHRVTFQKSISDSVSQELESFIEENSGEDGPLEEAKNDKDKVNKASISARKKRIKAGEGDRDELDVMDKCLSLFAGETAAKKVVKEAQVVLDKKVFEHYPKLSNDEVKNLVVDAKWMGYLEATIKAEIERVTQQLANRVKTLEERYTVSLTTLTEDVGLLSSKVDEHLKKMGLSW